MDESVLLIQLPIEGRGVSIVFPLAVKPDGANGAVVGQQFGQLVVHEAVVLRPVVRGRVMGQLLLVAS